MIESMEILIMENKVVIQNFGPVNEAQINLNKNFQIFIGTQASGKSTIIDVWFLWSAGNTVDIDACLCDNFRKEKIIYYN